MSNSAHGEDSPEVVFHDQQTGHIVTYRYSGGRIVSGRLTALVDLAGRSAMRSHPMNDLMRERSGRARPG